jgi:hypothetical protein
VDIRKEEEAPHRIGFTGLAPRLGRIEKRFCRVSPLSLNAQRDELSYFLWIPFIIFFLFISFPFLLSYEFVWISTGISCRLIECDPQDFTSLLGRRQVYLVGSRLCSPYKFCHYSHVRTFFRNDTSHYCYQYYINLLIEGVKLSKIKCWNFHNIYTDYWRQHSR